MKPNSRTIRPTVFALALAFILHRCRLLRRVILSGCLAALGSAFLLAQGPLAPPGAPAPTMKTLDQVEPRTPISAVGVIISSAGSYYLTANPSSQFVVNGESGITVAASGVTIDLNGFELVGFANSGSGITINNGVTNVTIRNGTIRNWTFKGIDGTGIPEVRVENVRVINNGGSGIIVDFNGEVRDCVAQGNVGYGIEATANCLIENCQVTLTTGFPGTGIITGDSCHIGRCAARGNANLGISAGSNNVGISNCTAQSNLQGGISAGKNASISNCTAQGNIGFGIRVTDNCTITDSAALSTTGAGSPGIATGDTGVVSGCTSRLNAGDNIRVGGSSTVVKCSASGSTGGNGINASSGYSLISQCTANGNNQHGINAFQRTRISDCTAAGNTQSGVHITIVGTVERCFCNGNTVCGILMDAGGFVDILNNNCSENGAATSGAGIRVSVAGGCRVEGNNLIQNFRGLDILVPRNVIGKNVANINSNADYNIVAGNSVGPIINVINVGDISGTAGANHPFANFRY